MSLKRRRTELDDFLSSKEELLARYSSLPRTGLYDISLPPAEQCAIFLNYAKYLKEQMYNAPRNTEIRRLNEIVKQICERSPIATTRLFELLEIDNLTRDFDIIMSAFKRASDEKNAGDKYKKYMIYYKKSLANPYTDDLINTIKNNLQKKYDQSKADKKLQEILLIHKNYQAECLASADKYKILMETDPQYLKWNEIQTLWISLDFNNLLKMFYDVTMMIKHRKHYNGVMLETICIDKILSVISERTHIETKDLTVLRNVKFQSSKLLLGEIDIVVLHENKIIACIESKSGIYDIPHAIEQIEKMKTHIHKPSILFYTPNSCKDVKLSVSDSPIYLVVTSLKTNLADFKCTSKLKTGASYADVQLISDVIFNNKNKMLTTIIEKESYDEADVTIVNDILNNLRKHMRCRIDVFDAIKILSHDLIVI